MMAGFRIQTLYILYHWLWLVFQIVKEIRFVGNRLYPLFLVGESRLNFQRILPMQIVDLPCFLHRHQFVMPSKFLLGVIYRNDSAMFAGIFIYISEAVFIHIDLVVAVFGRLYFLFIVWCRNSLGFIRSIKPMHLKVRILRQYGA